MLMQVRVDYIRILARHQRLKSRTSSSSVASFQMMEQMSILFDCVRRAGPTQAQLLAEILPQV